MAPRADYPKDWQLQCREIKQRGAHILKSEQWSDCSFMVGEFPNQVVIKAHKLILAMASPVFEAMFYGPMAEGSNPIPIPDIHPKTFQGLLDFIYTDHTELDSFNSACNLYYGAQKYMLPHLLTVCTTYLSCNLTPEVACQMYEFAHMVGEETLIKESEVIIMSKTSSILLLKGFEEASIEMVEKIFSLENLNISSELDLLNAAERYAKALSLNEACATVVPMQTEKVIEQEQDDGQGKPTAEKEISDGEEDNNNKKATDVIIDDTDKNNEKLPYHNYCLASTSKQKDQEKGLHCKPTEKLKTVVRKLVQQIRFLTLTPTELAEYPTLTTLLTESEILVLMMNIVSANTSWPMPEGFSMSKKKRCMSLPRVYFDVTADGSALGRIIFELRKDVVPKTCENFRALCTGEKGFGYKGSTFHYVNPHSCLGGGGFINHNGSGGKSIYGERFAAENFVLKHTGPGVLSMVNIDNFNDSQFLISTVKIYWLDGKTVVFGNVVEGMDVVKQIEALGSGSGKPSKKIVIADCGQLGV